MIKNPESRFQRMSEEDTRLDPSMTASIRHRALGLRWRDARGARGVNLTRRVVLGTAKHLPESIQDTTVSRLHAELELRDDGLWVRDLGSKNGTFVDDVRVALARVERGQTLRLGRTTMSILWDESPATIELSTKSAFGPLLGASVAMRAMFRELERIAAHDVTVLLRGETGTGKELVSQAIHERSGRASSPFVVVDCGALTETLLESELFGHARGAFTGAISARAGVLESANGGTVFLDEIGEMPLALQPRLLRALEDRTVRRLGENQRRSFDVRVIAATHRDLRAMVNDGTFREDLYFRLAVVECEIPPLRERREDIPLLAAHFAAKFAANLSTEDLSELSTQTFAGNVRELRNAVERRVVLGRASARLDIPAPSASRSVPVESAQPLPLDLATPFKVLRDLWTDRLEREYLQGLLSLHANNISAVANAAGLDRSYVHRLLRKHELG
jgi:transcriptional regulator with GAF, ATPase, and Fis domain